MCWRPRSQLETSSGPLRVHHPASREFIAESVAAHQACRQLVHRAPPVARLTSPQGHQERRRSPRSPRKAQRPQKTPERPQEPQRVPDRHSAEPDDERRECHRDLVRDELGKFGLREAVSNERRRDDWRKSSCRRSGDVSCMRAFCMQFESPLASISSDSSGEGAVRAC